MTFSQPFHHPSRCSPLVTARKQKITSEVSKLGSTIYFKWLLLCVYRPGSLQACQECCHPETATQGQQLYGFSALLFYRWPSPPQRHLICCCVFRHQLHSCQLIWCSFVCWPPKDTITLQQEEVTAHASAEGRTVHAEYTRVSACDLGVGQC